MAKRAKYGIDDLRKRNNAGMATPLQDDQMVLLILLRGSLLIDIALQGQELLMQLIVQFWRF